MCSRAPYKAGHSTAWITPCGSIHAFPTGWLLLQDIINSSSGFILPITNPCSVEKGGWSAASFDRISPDSEPSWRKGKPQESAAAAISSSFYCKQSIKTQVSKYRVPTHKRPPCDPEGWISSVCKTAAPKATMLISNDRIVYSKHLSSIKYTSNWTPRNTNIWNAEKEIFFMDLNVVKILKKWAFTDVTSIKHCRWIMSSSTGWWEVPG